MRFKPLLFCFLQAALVLTVSLHASPAEACSPPASPRYFYTLTRSFPEDGASNVPLDTVVLIQPRAWQIPGTLADVHVRFHDVLSVTVTDSDTGELIPGKVDSWWAGSSGEAWRPDAPLLPNRRYTFVATVQQSGPRPEEAQGPTELRGSFSTGDQLSPPLELLGGLDVALESIETDKLDCTSGACTCAKVGREMSTHAQVRVPGVQGGSAFGSYRFELWVTDNTPYRFDGMNQHLEHKVLWGVWGVNTSGEPTDTLFEMPRNHYDANASYTPCFTWRVLDPAGNVREGAPVCLKERVDPPGSFFGCTVAPGARGSQGTAFLVLLGAMLTVWRVRRRPVV
ncbi:hypothetical protein BO221_14255 [Archangium sp. Cb G35]|uniref:hypothetical protein n=1 Tax=Archangium sp. Cb G35 TaxID=1920190 RepID=UPI0009368193|nr:hypothetical protein [Archangium sp. Cb G35]OJT24331.1 hypothetical protein BO221_14255 [Archangium sp. Cb G35]